MLSYPLLADAPPKICDRITGFKGEKINENRLQISLRTVFLKSTTPYKGREFFMPVSRSLVLFTSITFPVLSSWWLNC